MIEPELLLKEIRECDVEPECLIVDEQAVVISSEDRKWEEAHLKDEIGSRWLSEILDAEHLVCRQVWYNRHMNLRYEVESGDVRIITNEEFKKLDGYHPEVVLDTVWQSALKAAKKTVEEVGGDLLWPWDDFEWGMVNGKLSAIRWVLGDEWGMLDT